MDETLKDEKNSSYVSRYEDLTERHTTTIIYPDGTGSVRECALLKEHELTVIINEQPAFRLICTKEYLRELVTGRLYTEGIIEKAEDIAEIYFCRYEKEASVFIEGDAVLEDSVRKDLSCCAGNIVFKTKNDRIGLKKLSAADYDPQWVFALAERFVNDSGLHGMTQGTHSCILAGKDGFVFSCEDIGRHNAVDKAVGYGLINNISLNECMLYTSGRIPVDMTEKVIAAGIPVLVSKSVPTAESAALAKEYGLTLIFRAHPDSFETIM